MLEVLVVVLGVPVPVPVPTEEELTPVADVEVVTGKLLALEKIWLIIIKFRSKSTYVGVLVLVLVPVKAVVAAPELEPLGVLVLVQVPVTAVGAAPEPAPLTVAPIRKRGVVQ